MNNKQLYWKLHQAKCRQAEMLEAKREQKEKDLKDFFATFLKLNVDFRRKKL